MWCRSRSRLLISRDGLRNLLGGGGLDVDLVDGHQADRLRRVGRLRAETKDRAPWRSDRGLLRLLTAVDEAGMRGFALSTALADWR